MNNFIQELTINAGVSIDNAIACIKRGDSDLAIRFLQNTKEILSYPTDFKPEGEGALNCFANADEWKDIDLDVHGIKTR